MYKQRVVFKVNYIQVYGCLFIDTNPKTQDNEFFLDYKLGNSGHGRIEFGRGI